MASNIPAAAQQQLITDPPTSNENAENQYFYEDEVFKFDSNGRVKFGLIMGTYEAGASDTEQSDFEDNIKQGEIRVAWHPKGTEEITEEKYIGLADRTLMPGDVVRRIIPGKDTQKGYCREVLVSADVSIKGTSYIAKNISSHRLRPLITMLRDNAVCLDSWVGSTKSVNEKLILKTACGSILELRPDPEYSTLKDADTKYRRGFFAGTLFYPGQTLVGQANSLDRDTAKWLSVTPEVKASRKATTFSVQSVETEGVFVQWQCKALSDASLDQNYKDSQPKNYVTGDDLKRLRRLNLFESCMLQINDKNYLTIEENDILNLTSKSQWRKERGAFFDSEKKLYNQIKLKRSVDREKLLSIANEEKPLPTNEDAVIQPSETFKSKTISTPSSQITNTNSTTTTTTTTKQSELLIDRKSNLPTKILSARLNPNDFEIVKIYRRFDHHLTQCNKHNADGWKTDDDDDDDDDENGSNSGSENSLTTGSSCRSSPTPRSSPKRSPLLTKKMKKFKKRNNKKLLDRPPRVGEEVVTETSVVYSTATVVWQDGTVETGISSRQLYPIHHLDEHEFFPGDFVLAGGDNSSDVSYRDYGVIQKVDHGGRTAIVKWFSTYTSEGNPIPTFFNESEVSVYDLKDHPDFQYRPGTIVIRVANFNGSDATCTAGQVVDNFPEGCVKVWWVDGHYSMCWPQDLFEVGQYDADHNFWLSGESDNESWETESVRSEPGSPVLASIRPQLATNLERARVAMAQLEELFCLNPNLENQEIMRKLLEVYKKCRFMDRLMNTSFFHEDKFMGLIERVRRVSTTATTTVGRVLDHKNRLFNDSPNTKLLLRENSVNSVVNMCTLSPTATAKESSQKTSSPKAFQLNSALKNALKLQKQHRLVKPELSIEEYCDDGTSRKTSLDISSKDMNYPFCSPINSTESESDFLSPNETFPSNTIIVTDVDKASSIEDTNLLTITGDNQNSGCLQKTSNTNSTNDSGNHTKTECGEASYCSSSDITTDIISSSLKQPNDEQTSNSCFSIDATGTEELSDFACARLCTLIKAQLVKALKEINDRFYEASNFEDEEVENMVSSSDVNEFEKNIVEDDVNSCNSNGDAKSHLELEELPPNSEAIDEIETETTDRDERSIANSTLTSPMIEMVPAVPSECYVVLDNAPTSHTFNLTLFHPTNVQQFYRAVRFDHKLLNTALPPGVWVRVYEDRMDLLSVMIEGPKKTPYEEGMFLFDIQLGKEYPKVPPLCHYISYCTDRLNPNLYEDGKVCVSLLGTWSGRGSEVWGVNSTLLQVIVSIQGLILVAEPYFNEAGYDKQRGTQQGMENSRMYNEMVVLKLMQSMSKMITNPSEIFREKIEQHFCNCGTSIYERIKGWMDMSNEFNERNKQLQTGDNGGGGGGGSDSNGRSSTTSVSSSSSCCDHSKDTSQLCVLPTNENSKERPLPEFSLVPASRGFCLTLAGLLENFRNKVSTLRAANGMITEQQP